ncbi:MAG: hypothetical protein QMB52_11555 [Propionivibrio sp.]
MEQKTIGPRPNPYVWSPFYWIAYLLCSLPGWLLQLVFNLVGRSGMLIHRLVKARRAAKAEAGTAQVSDEPRSVVAKPSVEETTDQWGQPPTIASEISRVELPRGYVVFRYLASQGIVKGKLTVTETARSGKRKKPITVLVEGSCSSLSEATRTMKAKGEEALISLAAQKKGKTKNQRPGTTAAVRAEGMEGTPGDLEIPMYLRSEDAEMQTGRELNPDPFEHFATSPPEAEVPKRRLTAPKPASTEVSYKGVLLAFGKENRKLDDPVKGERNVQHFCVRIFDEQLQAEQPLWGNDLRRVLEESDAKVGDRVELGLVGETEVLVKGRPTKKKVWSLTKL